MWNSRLALLKPRCSKVVQIKIPVPRFRVVPRGKERSFVRFVKFSWRLAGVDSRHPRAMDPSTSVRHMNDKEESITGSCLPSVGSVRFSLLICDYQSNSGRFDDWFSWMQTTGQFFPFVSRGSTLTIRKYGHGPLKSKIESVLIEEARVFKRDADFVVEAQASNAPFG